MVNWWIFIIIGHFHTPPVPVMLSGTAVDIIEGS